MASAIRDGELVNLGDAVFRFRGLFLGRIGFQVISGRSDRFVVPLEPRQRGGLLAERLGDQRALAGRAGLPR